MCATPSYFQISWHNFQRDTLVLGEKILSHTKKVDPWVGILAITRGGLVPANLLAHQLDVRLIETICISSYDDETESQGRIHVLKGPEASLCARQGQGWLVIDDLVDSGKTLTIVREKLPLAYFAAVYAKPQGEQAVDVFSVAIPQKTWAVFPWEESEKIMVGPAGLEPATTPL